ncbi:DUF4279 domain-containing protein [Acrocarpospora sp. B8E8]|uniref:DUF4279 domain-containing protein n=1 Tax=Acrocarpospora sp. B8E8 TaxID=3153572 RepID=UPI00325C8015
MFRISLRLVSDSGDPDEVSLATDVVPEKTEKAGEMSPRTGNPYKFSQWTARIGPQRIAGSPDDAFHELASWGLPTAEAIRKLVAEGCWEATLMIVQEFRDPENVFEKGISMDPKIIEWLAASGAGADIDQYILYE